MRLIAWLRDAWFPFCRLPTGGMNRFARHEFMAVAGLKGKCLHCLLSDLALVERGERQGVEKSAGFAIFVPSEQQMRRLCLYWAGCWYTYTGLCWPLGYTSSTDYLVGWPAKACRSSNKPNPAMAGFFIGQKKVSRNYKTGLIITGDGSSPRVWGTRY